MRDQDVTSVSETAVLDQSERRVVLELGWSWAGKGTGERRGASAGRQIGIQITVRKFVTVERGQNGANGARLVICLAIIQQIGGVMGAVAVHK
jgi:hypothetical protein